MNKHAPLVVFLTASTGALVAQQTWTVPTHAPNLQAAIAAAAPGDTITMSAGYTEYGSTTLDRAVTLADCRMDYGYGGPALRIVDLAGGRRIELRNVQIHHVVDGFAGPIPDALQIHLPATATGLVVLDDVRCFGGFGLSAGLRVTSLGSAALAARACTFTGRSGGPLIYHGSGEQGPRGGVGAEVAASGSYVFENCTFLGGKGGFGYANQMTMVAGAPGGPGILAFGNGALVDCTITDGDGGDALAGNPPPEHPPADPCALAALPGLSLMPRDLHQVTWQRGCVGTVTQCSQQPQRPPLAIGVRATDLVPSAATFTTGQVVTVQVLWHPGDVLVGLIAGDSLQRSQVAWILGPGWIDPIVYGAILTPPTAGNLSIHALLQVPVGLTGPIDFVTQLIHARDTEVELGAPRIVTLRP